MKKPPTLLWGDIIIMGLVLLTALSGFILLPGRLARATALRAEIYQEGQLLHSIELSGKPQELRLEHKGGYNVLGISPEGIFMAEASCPNQDCIRAGLQNRPGSVLACLPQQLLIRLVGAKEAELDAVAY